MISVRLSLGTLHTQPNSKNGLPVRFADEKSAAGLAFVNSNLKIPLGWMEHSSKQNSILIMAMTIEQLQNNKKNSLVEVIGNSLGYV